MLSIIKKESNTKDGNLLEIRGLSTDTKPTENISNGSQYIEMDTGKIYHYNAESQQWLEF